MEKKVTLESLIIFPNPGYAFKADYIISAHGIEALTTSGGFIRTKERYYIASTNTRQVFEHFYNDALTNEDKVPAITHMLYKLREEYGCDFCYIQPAKTVTNERRDGEIIAGN